MKLRLWIAMIAGSTWCTGAEGFWLHADYDQDEVALGLVQPTAMDIAPDGRIFIAEKRGDIRIIDVDGELLDTPFVSIPVESDGDRGLLGVELDPHFDSNGWVYARTVSIDMPENPVNDVSRIGRVLRFTADGNEAEPGSEVVVLDDLPSDELNHNGGALHFFDSGDPRRHDDPYLFVGLGENKDEIAALRPGSLKGKMLRTYADGTPPEDNPFFEGPGSPRSLIYASGLRNPFTFAVRQSDGRVFVADVGSNIAEEVNRLVAGANYGWPCYEGLDPQPIFWPQFEEICEELEASPPLYKYDHIVPAGGCASGIVVYEDDVFPEEFRGNLFITDCTQKWIRRIELAPDDSVIRVTRIGQGSLSFFPVDLDVGPDGFLYLLWYSTNYSGPSGSVWRLRWVGDGNHAPLVNATATPPYGYAPLTVDFSSEGTRDRDGDDLAYLWEFGDGQSSDEPHPSHSYGTDGRYDVTLRVTDGQAIRRSDFSIQVGSTPPAGRIRLPVEQGHFVANSIVEFEGFADDPDEGLLSPEQLRWSVLLRHNFHHHPVLDTTGSGGSFFADVHDTTGTYSYEIQLHVTDSTGLEDTRSIVIEEATRNLALERNVSASSTHERFGTGHPSHAVDGRLMFGERIPSLWHSEPDAPGLAHWQVDLGQPQRVSLVAVRARPDADEEGCRKNLAIEGSNDPSFSSDVHRLASIGHEPFPAGGTWAPQIGVGPAVRFVRVRKTVREPGAESGAVFLNLAEVEVYGRPDQVELGRGGR